MNRVSKVIIFFGALMMIAAGIALGAPGELYQEQNAQLCYEETVKVANGADPGDLSTVRCERALRIYHLDRESKSAILHNRGIIERAKGDLVAARSSLEDSVRLSRTVDMRNLALAEIARELGDYRAAADQYELLSSSDFLVEYDHLQAAVHARQQEADATYFASIESGKACGGCHGANGISASPTIPTLAGRQEEYLEHALQQYRNGQRESALMTSQALLLSDREVALLARYFGSLD